MGKTKEPTAKQINVLVAIDSLWSKLKRRPDAQEIRAEAGLASEQGVYYHAKNFVTNGWMEPAAGSRSFTFRLTPQGKAYATGQPLDSASAEPAPTPRGVASSAAVQVAKLVEQSGQCGNCRGEGTEKGRGEYEPDLRCVFCSGTGHVVNEATTNLGRQVAEIERERDALVKFVRAMEGNHAWVAFGTTSRILDEARRGVFAIVKKDAIP